MSEQAVVEKEVDAPNLKTDALARPTGRSLFLQKLGDYAADSPIALLSAMTLSLGGLLLLQYALRIGYLPDADLAGMSSVLYAVAVMGLLLLGFAMVTLVMPGLVMAGFRGFGRAIRKRDVATASWLGAVAWGVWLAYLFFDLSYCQTALVILLGWAVGSGLIHGLASRKRKSAPADSNSAAEPMQAQAQARDQASTPDDSKALSLAIWLPLSALINALILSLPMILIFGFGRHGDINHAKEPEAYWVLGWLILLLAVGNTVIACAKKQDRPVITLVAAPFFLFMILMGTGSFSAVSAIAAHKLGLGSGQPVAAVVTSQTCAQINKALRQQVCAPGADAQAPSLLCPVALRSRLGSQVLLDFAPMRVGTQERKGQTELDLQWAPPLSSNGLPDFTRIVLDKKELLTWTRLRTEGLPVVAKVGETPGLASPLTTVAPAASDAQKAAVAAITKVCSDASTLADIEGKNKPKPG